MRCTCLLLGVKQTLAAAQMPLGVIYQLRRRSLTAASARQQAHRQMSLNGSGDIAV